MHKRISIIVVILILNIGCASEVDHTLEQMAQRDRQHYPDIVQYSPDGFITLDSALEGIGGVLTTLFWSTNFVVQDSEDITIFQTGVRDNNFIVIYKNAFYINEGMFNEIAKYATDIFEQRNRIYDIGDIIEIRGISGEDSEELWGWGNPRYSLEITSIESDITSESAIYHIKFSITPAVDERHILDFFNRVTTHNGSIYSDFILVNHETIRIELSSHEIINMLVLSVPRELRVSSFQNTIRRVRVGNDG